MIKSRMELSIIIPSYNELNNLKYLIKKINSIVLKNRNIEIIIVDNGSTDGSKNYLENNKKLFPKIKFVRVKKNIGYGHGILTGLQLAKGDILSWTHADLQTDPYDVVLAFKEHKKHNDSELVIKGKRRNRNFIDSFFTWGMQVYCSLKLKSILNDINAQPKLFSRKFYEKNFKNPPLDFSLDLYLLLNAKRIKTVDVFFHKRKFGEAKGGGSIIGKIRLTRRTFKYISTLRKKKGEKHHV